MVFPYPLIGGRLIRRYKRFLADVVLDTGEKITAHCPNTGAMLGCDKPDSQVWLSQHDNPKRKYPHTWEIVAAEPEVLVGIHSRRANALVREAMESGVISELSGYASIHREAVYDGGRLDFLLRDGRRAPCYVEVKSVTAAVERGGAIFPDARSVRGTRHLHDLIRLQAQGYRAVTCYCVQRGDVYQVRPADAIDPEYGRAMRAAQAAGVELIAYRCRVTPQEIRVVEPLPVIL